MGDIINFPGNADIPNPPAGDFDFKKIRQEYAAERRAELTEDMHQALMIKEEELEDSLMVLSEKVKEPDRAALKLHLELVNSNVNGESILSDEQASILKKYGKVKDSVSRDIIVPADMSLHALHYAIQRLFGWQNSHLHKFYITDDDFDLVTAGRYDTYMDLVGVLFRFPQEEYDDFWDDDYTESMNFKTWLKHKYSRPFYTDGTTDSFVHNQALAREMIQSYIEKTSKKGRQKPKLTDRDINPDSYLVDIDNQIFIGAPWNNLIQSVSVGDLLDVFTDEHKRMNVKHWKTGVMIDKAEVIRSILDLQKDSSMSEEEFLYIISGTYVKMLPYFDTIYYNYDFGDNWKVRITAVDYYSIAENFNEEDPDESDDYINKDYINKDYFNKDYLNSEGLLIEGELRECVNAVSKSGVPVCIAADGLNVLDDAGNVYGYVEMLETINGNDKEEAAGMRAWAKSQGWTGRKVKPKNML